MSPKPEPRPAGPARAGSGSRPGRCPAPPRPGRRCCRWSWPARRRGPPGRAPGRHRGCPWRPTRPTPRRGWLGLRPGRRRSPRERGPRSGRPCGPGSPQWVGPRGAGPRRRRTPGRWCRGPARPGPPRRRRPRLWRGRPARTAGGWPPPCRAHCRCAARCRRRAGRSGRPSRPCLRARRPSPAFAAPCRPCPWQASCGKEWPMRAPIGASPKTADRNLRRNLGISQRTTTKAVSDGLSPRVAVPL